MSNPILWSAEQICSQCGQGAYVAERGVGFVCTHCQHVTQYSDFAANLGEGERLEWHTVRPSGPSPTLHVTAYDTTEED